MLVGILTSKGKKRCLLVSTFVGLTQKCLSILQGSKCFPVSL